MILKNGNWKYDDELYRWLKSNFIPNSNEGQNKHDEYIMYDNGFLVDLSIFMYLLIYSILNQKAIDNNNRQTKENIHFSDFLTINKKINSELKLFQYITYINDVINIYELHNIYNLKYIDKLSLDENNELNVTREFESLYGVLWYIFKLNLVDLYSRNKNDSIVSLNICIDCGIPILGDKSRCEECDIINAKERKQKSRQHKIDNINLIISYASKYDFPDDLKNRIIILLKTNPENIKSFDIKKLLQDIKIYCICNGYDIKDIS